MDRIGAFLCALLFAWPVFAGATIEGVVRKASGAKLPVPAGKYKPTVDPIGKPDPIRAVVYLEGSFPKTNLVSQTNVIQKQYQFRPGVLVIQSGTEVAFPNEDNEYHSVFSFSKSKRFDLGKYRKNEKPPVLKFETPGMVELFCDIHSHMRGTIFVLDTPYYTTTDPATGKFRLENLPPGKHTLKMWLGKNDEAEQAVELKEGETLVVDFR